MFRLIGFLVGAASAIVMLLLVLGMPEFHLPDAAADQQRFDVAVEKLKEKQQEAMAVAEVIVEKVATAVDYSVNQAGGATVHSTVDSTMDSAMEPAMVSAIDVPIDNTETVAATTPQQLSEVVEEPATQDFAAMPPGYRDIDVADDMPVVVEDLQWYSFWNPFRSELAANGFVSQLEKVTGLDYRVVKVKTGVYEVAFAYASDMERHSKIAQIASATGLDLPDS